MLNLVKGATTRERLMQKLQKAYPKMFIRTTEEFDGREGGIWIGAEEGIYDREGYPVFNYYSESSRYDLGVIDHMYRFLERNGWYAEWYDCGTIMLVKE